MIECLPGEFFQQFVGFENIFNLIVDRIGEEEQILIGLNIIVQSKGKYFAIGRSIFLHPFIITPFEIKVGDVFFLKMGQVFFYTTPNPVEPIDGIINDPVFFIDHHIDNRVSTGRVF
jgi:hypothetical protein